jgi:hypothetical protein
MAQAQTGPWGTPGVTGSIAQTTFSRGAQGQTILKSKPQPTNPRTASQQAGRAMFGFVAKQWALLPALDQGSYDAPAAAALISPFAQYSKDNALRHQQGQAPSQNRAAAEEETPSVPTIAAVLGSDGADNVVTVTITGAATDWGIAVYHADGENPSGAKAQLIAVRAVATEAQTIDIPHAGTATSQYAVRTFTVDGKFSALVQEA